MPTWSPKNEEFAKRLKVAREIQGWTQAELGRRTGIARAHIAKIENALCHVRLDEATLLTRALGIALAPDEEDYHIGVRHGFAAGAQMLIDFADKMKAKEEGGWSAGN